MSRPRWRPLGPGDLAAADAIGIQVHPGHPERPAVFAERLALDPDGCLALAAGDAVLGYAISHRSRLGAVPALDTLLGTLPSPADTRYVHDIALLPECRGAGHGGAAVSLLADQARAAGLATLSLVAVGASAPFWRRHGFADAPLASDLSSYGAATFMVRPLR